MQHTAARLKPFACTRARAGQEHLRKSFGKSAFYLVFLGASPLAAEAVSASTDALQVLPA